MKLTKTERLILANQLRILEVLEPSEATAHAIHRKALEGGFALQYERLFDGLSEELSEAECEYVLHVLDLHSHLQLSFDGLTDKTGINAQSIKFRGFDGNNEEAHLAYANYFINSLDRYSEFQEANLNSHMPTRSRYENMLSVWSPIRSANPTAKLTKEEIQKILA